MAVVGLVGLGIYKEFTPRPDRVLFVLPLFLVAFYMRQSGLSRYKEFTEDHNKPEQ